MLRRAYLYRYLILFFFTNVALRDILAFGNRKNVFQAFCQA